MSITPLLPCFAALWLAACVPYASRPLVAGHSAAAFTGRSLSDPGLRQFLAGQGTGAGAWDVDRLALAAAYFQGEVVVARAEAQAVAAGIRTAGQRPNPVLSFSPGYNTTSKGISPWLLSPAVEVTLETAGKRGLRLASARAKAEAAQLRVAVAAWDARAKVRSAMLDLHAAGENTTLLNTEVALHETVVDKLLMQVHAGETPGFELTQGRLGLSRAKLALHDAEKQDATSRAQLAAAVGVPSAALEAVTLDFSEFTTLPAAPGAGMRQHALTHRADLLAALADYAAADAELRLEIAKQYPDVHLSPGYEFDQGDNKWSLGFGMEVPILNQNRGPIAEAQAKRKVAGARFEAKQQAVFGEIETALAAYHAAMAKAGTATKLAEQAAHASDTTGRMVAAGELAPLELTRRRIEASTAKLALLEASIQAQVAVGRLEAAVQRPLRGAK
ncbi:MAG: TolC family protein [Verrucomicrobia bacterium]|nr:TolC family protein [Verrucomicrobiota bacterium]